MRSELFGALSLFRVILFVPTWTTGKLKWPETRNDREAGRPETQNDRNLVPSNGMRIEFAAEKSANCELFQV
jgi:hypothetical protein